MTAISLQQLREFTPQAIKDTLWAMATIGYTPAKPFLQGAADLCLRLISQFNPQNIANAIWAFAKFNFNPGRYAVSAGVSVHHITSSELVTKLAQELVSGSLMSHLMF